jgi:hypothetical protein
MLPETTIIVFRRHNSSETIDDSHHILEGCFVPVRKESWSSLVHYLLPAIMNAIIVFDTGKVFPSKIELADTALPLLI